MLTFKSRISFGETKQIIPKKYSRRGDLSFKNAIQKLLNDGYLTTIRKKEDKYYISDINKTNLALISHGYITNNGLSWP